MPFNHVRIGKANVGVRRSHGLGRQKFRECMWRKNSGGNSGCRALRPEEVGGVYSIKIAGHSRRSER